MLKKIRSYVSWSPDAGRFTSMRTVRPTGEVLPAVPASPVLARTDAFGISCRVVAGLGLVSFDDCFDLLGTAVALGEGTSACPESAASAENVAACRVPTTSEEWSVVLKNCVSALLSCVQAESPCNSKSSS